MQPSTHIARQNICSAGCLYNRTYAYELCTELVLLMNEQACSKFGSIVPRRRYLNPRASVILSEATREVCGHLGQAGWVEQL
jgi:hypothetical protein